MWSLDPHVSFLNHGSFGACPSSVLEVQAAFRAEMEREPVRFFRRRYPALLDEARRSLASVLSTDPTRIVFVANASEGVSTVLRSWDLSDGDEILTTDHEYGACLKALRRRASETGATIRTVHVKLPVSSEEDVLESLSSSVGPRTRYAMVSHITSPTALVFPIRRVCAALEARGVRVLVDGAHTLGQVPLDVDAIGASWFVGNAHKWLCAPKSAGFLVVKDESCVVKPLVWSHEIEDEDWQRSFDWTGTFDPSSLLSIPAAIQFLQGGDAAEGFARHMARNHELAVNARELLLDRLKAERPAPAQMLGAMAFVPLPPGPGPLSGAFASPPTDLERHLEDHGIQVPLVIWPGPPHRGVRISCQAYNTFDEYRTLADVLTSGLEREAVG
ncbi:MAG: aminotransferase class V-fold PLP-dependent enzyme [Myxococcales bacterium]|nr:aminotransferase class V-fold PLP-dependent enzyme [Myxococcales bacterium]